MSELQVSEVDRYDEYHKFVGLFMSVFSIAEESLRQILLHLSQMDEERFKTFVGFPLTSTAIDKIKASINTYPLSEKSDKIVRSCLTQLNHILTLRDRIAHYGGYISKDGYYVIRTKQRKESTVTGKPHDLFTECEVYGALADLVIILGTINAHIPGIIPEEYKKSSRVLNLDEHYTWQYKPPEQRNIKN